MVQVDSMALLVPQPHWIHCWKINFLSIRLRYFVWCWIMICIWRLTKIIVIKVIIFTIIHWKCKHAVERGMLPSTHFYFLFLSLSHIRGRAVYTLGLSLRSCTYIIVAPIKQNYLTLVLKILASSVPLYIFYSRPWNGGNKHDDILAEHFCWMANLHCCSSTCNPGEFKKYFYSWLESALQTILFRLLFLCKSHK